MEPCPRTPLKSGHLWYCGHLVLIYMFVYNQNTWNVEIPIFRKAYSFPSPIRSWTVQNSLNSLDTCLQLLKDCVPPQVNSKMGIISALLLIVITSYGNGEVRKCSLILIVLNNPTTHYPTSRNIPEAPEIQIPPYNGHTAVVPMVSALEWFHCSLLHSRKITMTKTKH